jgi:hypothetical protein
MIPTKPKLRRRPTQKLQSTVGLHTVTTGVHEIVPMVAVDAAVYYMAALLVHDTMFHERKSYYILKASASCDDEWLLLYGVVASMHVISDR